VAGAGEQAPAEGQLTPMAFTLRPAGLGSEIDKDREDYIWAGLSDRASAGLQACPDEAVRKAYDDRAAWVEARTAGYGIK
jgi:hypothetical protein